MLGEILVGALVVAVAVLVAVDISRTKSDSPQDHADGLAHDVRPGLAADTRRGRVDAFGDSAGTRVPPAVMPSRPGVRTSTPPAGSAAPAPAACGQGVAPRAEGLAGYARVSSC